MDEKDKKDDFSIKSTFESWLDIEGEENVSFVLGNTPVGKSTICQLIKKIIDNDPHPNLKLIEKKKDWLYECEGEINPKFSKPITIYPKKYVIKSEKMNIIEVPSRIYSLEKKRSFIDKLLNTVGLVYAAKYGSFVFVIDAKTTSGKCEPWKKTFQTIFDSFDINLLNEKTFKAVGFIVVSKSTSYDFEKDVFLNRIEDLYKLFEEEKRKPEYTELLRTIEKEKSLSVFKKTTQNEEIIKKDIIEVYELFKKLSKSSIPLQSELGETHQMISLEPVMLEKEEESLFDKFNEILGIIFDFFSKFFEKLFLSEWPVNILNFGESKQSEEKQKELQVEHFLKKIWPADSNLELKEQKIARNKLNELRKISSENKLFYQDIFGKASILIKYQEKMETVNENSHKTLSNFLEILAEHGLIEESSAELPELESLYLELIQYSIFEERFGPFIKNINYKKMLIDKNISKKFKELYQEIIQVKIHEDFLNNKFSLNITSENARKFLKIIDKIFTPDLINEKYEKSIPLLKKSLVLLTFDRSDPKKAIVEIDLLLQKIIYEDKILEEIEKNKENLSPELGKEVLFLNNLALEVAKVLQDCGRPDLCAEIFQDCGNFHSAMKCYQIKLKNTKTEELSNAEDTKEIINSYLELLMNMGLYEKALEECYELAEIYKPFLPEINKKRKEIKQKRLLPENEENEKIIEERFLKNSVKLSSFYSNKNALNKIKEMAEKNRK